jgi:hypothetical protein
VSDRPTGPEEELAPRPSALIESLRSFGYSPATSVADLVDNSLSAGASRIDVRFHWDGPDSLFTLTDDGHGMTATELRDAMRAGSSSPLDERSAADLGRFGLGLKTASFAQARVLTVISRRNGVASVRCWDLDHVRDTDRWVLLTDAPGAAELAERELPADGTIVRWNRLDRIVDDRPATDKRAEQSFFRTVDEVRAHLEMVFHRFLSGADGVTITVNGLTCAPWDPFLESHPATERLHDETIAITGADGVVGRLAIQPFVLPHNSALTPEEHRRAAGPRGWNLQQGYYLYRARRLIVAGNWFDPGMKPEEHHKLARIRVEITQEMDADWALDVRKSRARPPSHLSGEFRRIARATRDRGAEVYRARGRREMGQRRRERLTPVWIGETDGRAMHFRINRDHPVLGLSERSPAERRELTTILRLIESSLPVAHILSQGYTAEEKLTGEEPLDEQLLQTAEDLFGKLIEQGETPAMARERLAAVQPFDRATALLVALEERFSRLRTGPPSHHTDHPVPPPETGPRSAAP